MDEINNLFAKYSVEGVEFATPGSGQLLDYNIGKQLGHGAYATVKIATWKQSSEKFAIKIYDKFKLVDPQRKKSVQR